MKNTETDFDVHMYNAIDLTVDAQESIYDAIGQIGLAREVASQTYDEIAKKELISANDKLAKLDVILKSLENL